MCVIIIPMKCLHTFLKFLQFFNSFISFLPNFVTLEGENTEMLNLYHKFGKARKSKRINSNNFMKRKQKLKTFEKH